MESTTDYETKWRANRGFLATIDDAYGDWLVTVAYHTGIAAIECLMAKDQVAKSERFNAMKTNRRYQSLWKSLRPLQEASRIARGRANAKSADGQSWLSIQDVRDKLIGEKLEGIEKLVIRLMGLDKNTFSALPGGSSIPHAVRPASAIPPMAASQPPPAQAPAAAAPAPAAQAAAAAQAQQRSGLIIPSHAPVPEGVGEAA